MPDTLFTHTSDRLRELARDVLDYAVKRGASAAEFLRVYGEASRERRAAMLFSILEVDERALEELVRSRFSGMAFGSRERLLAEAHSNGPFGPRASRKRGPLACARGSESGPPAEAGDELFNEALGASLARALAQPGV